jgi:hypothetical protein
MARRRDLHELVIPGRRAAANPESRRPRRRYRILDSGFARKRAPRNDGGE